MDKEYHRQYNIKRYHRLRTEYVAQLGGECVDCGAQDQLEFDHIDPVLKELEIGRMLNVSKTKRDAEVAKCELRCASCHKQRSIQQLSVDHGGGITGKRNCYCDLCKPLKAEYMRQWRKR